MSTEAKARQNIQAFEAAQLIDRCLESAHSRVRFSLVARHFVQAQKRAHRDLEVALVDAGFKQQIADSMIALGMQEETIWLPR